MSPPKRESRPGGDTETAPKSLTRTANILRPEGMQRPIGPHPDVDVLFVGALLWSRAADATTVLALVVAEDIESPALAVVLGAVRTLAYADKPIGPQVVLDELRRAGKLRGRVADQLKGATTSGADSAAARYYGAAVVSGSLRRRVESAGEALQAMAAAAPECDLAPMVERAATAITDCDRRLTALRGETR